MNHQPCPEKLADACLEAAWRDDIDDDVRELLEQSFNVIKYCLYSLDALIKDRAALRDRLVTQAKVLEIIEAEIESRRFPLLDDDDPGLGL